METSVIIALLGIASSIGSFMAGRRKRHADAVGQELSNMQKAIHVWKEVAEYQTREITKLRMEIEELKKELSKVEQKYRELFKLEHHINQLQSRT